VHNSIDIAMLILHQLGDDDLLEHVFPTSDESIIIKHNWRGDKLMWEIDYDGDVAVMVEKRTYYDIPYPASGKINLTELLK